jgi:hypothetical protein
MEFEQKNKNITYQSGYTSNTAEDNNLSTFRALSLTRKSVSRLQRPRLWRERLLLPLKGSWFKVQGSRFCFKFQVCLRRARLRLGSGLPDIAIAEVGFKFRVCPGASLSIWFALLKHIVKLKTFLT